MGAGFEKKRGVGGRRTGLLTEEQLSVLGLRLEGLKQDEIARRLGTSRQNVSLIERRARGNLSKAELTLKAYRRLETAATVELKPGTHLVDVPRMLVDAADEVGVKIRVDFALVYKELRYEAGSSIQGTRVIKPILLHILRDGKIDVESVGTVTLFSFDEGQGLSEHTAPYDALVNILDGEAEVTIEGKPLTLREGEMTIMPANKPHALKAPTRFKMLLIMIRA